MSDLPDFTLETGDAAMGDDLPDFTTNVPAGSGGAYKSLTGPGETATPGDLTQEGGFTINEGGSTGFSYTDTGAGGFAVYEKAGGLIYLEGGSAGIDLQCPAGASFFSQVGATTSTHTSITQQDNEIVLSAPGAGKVTVGDSTTDLVGFYGSNWSAQQSGRSITTVAELVTALQNLGLLGP